MTYPPRYMRHREAYEYLRVSRGYFEEHVRPALAREIAMMRRVS